MFDKFGEYMQYLLPSAFKRQKKTNQLLKYCGIIGGMYDTLLQSALRLREESIIATCSPEMLEVFGRDYDMPRLRGETDDIYRRRLQMKALIAEKAGTEHGILYALASVGCDNCTITPLYLSNPEKWAEIRINIFTASVDEDILVAWRCIVAEVMKVKKASTLPHWRIYYPVEIWENNINSIRAAVRFIFFIQYWRCRIYNGNCEYDGEAMYDARRNYRMGVLIRHLLRIYTREHAVFSNRIISGARTREYITSSFRSLYCISFWGCAVYAGPCGYDGCMQYDARRRYGLRMTITDNVRAHTMQSVQFRYGLCVNILNRERADLVKKNKCRIRESAPAEKTRIRICMSVRFPPETIDNVYIETCRNVAYFDDTLTYDGTAKYDALYRKEEVE